MQKAECKIKKRKKERFGYVLLAVFMAVCITTSFVRAAQVEYTTREVVVQEGDSLWSIWEEVGHGRFDKWKVEVERLNAEDVNVIHPYDRITVPVVK